MVLLILIASATSISPSGPVRMGLAKGECGATVACCSLSKGMKGDEETARVVPVQSGQPDLIFKLVRAFRAPAILSPTPNWAGRERGQCRRPLTRSYCS